MSTLAAVLEREIESALQRHARAQAQLLRQLQAQQRQELDRLSRRIDVLERQLAVRSADGAPPRTRRATALVEAAEPQLRFSAKGFAKLRQRLGISAAAMGTLVGVTAQSVYKWEDGKARPRASQLQAIAALRGLGKREAAARLAQLDDGAERQRAA